MHLAGPLVVLLLLALGLVVLETRAGWGVRDEDRVLFAPAIGLIAVGAIGLAAGVAGFAWALRWIGLLLAILILVRWRVVWRRLRASDYLTRFVLIAFALSLASQFALAKVFQRAAPGPDRIWTAFNMTGVSPPDQMFAWRQATWYQHKLHYAHDKFYEDMDLFDRPHFGGAVTLFVAECLSFQFPNEHLPAGSVENYEFPRSALRTYQSFWRSLNTLYLLGIAVLARRLLGNRMAILAVGLCALSAHFVLSSGGIWVKFAPLYLLLLMVALLIEVRATILAGILGAAAFHLHGSMLPFLVGAGAYLLSRWITRSRAERPAARRAVAAFAACGLLFIGPWFVIPKLMGSKQPLMMYYLYDAGLTEAQHSSREQIQREFHARTSPAGLVALPIYNVLRNLTPYRVIEHIGGFSYRNPAHASLRNISSALMHSETHCLPAAIGIWAVPLVYVGLVRMLQLRRWDILLLFAYAIPTVFVALLYRKDRMIMTPVISPYHAIAALAACLALRRVSVAGCFALCLVAVADNLFVSLFAWERFHPETRGLAWDAIWSSAGGAVALYAVLLISIAVLTGAAMNAMSKQTVNSPTAPGCLGFERDMRTICGLPPILWKVGATILAAVGILIAYGAMISRSFR